MELLTTRTPQEPASPEADLVIVNGMLVTPDEVRTGTLVVREGTISDILPADTPPPPGKQLDASGRYVLPGLIDSHVHFRVPGLEHKEDWEYGSRAAIAGGITTVMDMPNTNPPSMTEVSLVAKAELIGNNSWVDYAFHLGADPTNPYLLANIDPLVARSAKIFMAGHHTAPVVFRDRPALNAAFASAAHGNLLLVIHGEDQNVFDMIDSVRGQPDSYHDYESARPRSAGIVAAMRIIDLVRKHGTKTHILHISSQEEVDLFTAAAREGLPITFEVTGHHLSFTHDDTAKRGPRTRLSPAIRSEVDRTRLWESIIDGSAATVGSDHAPHTIEEKNRPPALAPPGLPGVQELATVLWSGLLSPPHPVSSNDAARHLARVLGSGPADLFGLAGKGRLIVGGDADIALLDPHSRWQITHREIQAKCGWSAYEGWVFNGRFTHVVKSGHLAWTSDDGFVGSPCGTWIQNSPQEAHLSEAAAS